MQETWVRSLGQKDPLEEGMGTHSSILAWRIPWTEEPGGLVCRVVKSRTRTKQLNMHARTQGYLCPKSFPTLQGRTGRANKT